MKYWGIEPTYDTGRAIEIYEAIKDLPIKNVLDCCCGEGLILETLSWAFPATYVQFDIEEYPEWKKLRATPFTADVMDFIKVDQPFDLVLMLNSYRNAETGFDKDTFNKWLNRNAKYFITSDGEGKVIGTDVKGHKLTLQTL